MTAQEGISLPDSPYLAQLQQGFRGLRFVRALEREFQAEFSEQHLGRVRAGFGVAMLVYSLFLLLRLRVESGAVEQLSMLLRGGAISAMALTLVASYVRPARAFLHWFVLASYGLFAAAVTGVEIVAHRYGVERHYEGLILVSFHVYVFSGLLLRPALLAGAFIFLAYLIGGAIGGLASREWGYQLLFIAMTHLIGGMALYSIERTERDSFLRRRLYGSLATLDSLTGLFNRMAFFQQLERLVRQAAREHVAVAVALIDVDHFKKFNDRYGHLEGDACLRAVAHALRDEFKRPLDVVARYGGEEFIGLWYDVQPQSVRVLAEQLRAAVQALKLTNRDAPSGRVTASIGVVVCEPSENEPLLALTQRADAALYEAKARGRNRVVVEVLASATRARHAGGRRAPTVSGVR